MAGFALERFRQIGEKLRASDAGVATVSRLVDAAAKPTSSLTCNGSIPALERKSGSRAEPTSKLQRETETAYALSICYALEAGKAAGKLQDSAEDAAALHRLRGDVLLRLKGDAPSAEQEYRQAIALRPGDPALQERLAEAQFQRATQRARKSATAAVAIDPHQRDAMRTLASLAMNSRDYEQALPWLRELGTQSPGDRSVQVELGKALAQTGHPDEALKCLAPALAAGYPDEKGALHSLEAGVLREVGRDADAAKAAAEARRSLRCLPGTATRRMRERTTDANQ